MNTDKLSFKSNDSIISQTSAYSVDTNKFMQGLCDEIGMPTNRQRLLKDFLEEEDAEFLSLPKQNNNKARNQVIKSGTETKGNLMSGRDLKLLPKLRKKEKIVQSGAYQRDQTIPLQRGRPRTDWDKDNLVFHMAYRRPLPADPDINDLLTGKLAQAKDDKFNPKTGQRYEELLKEIEDREEFISRMRELRASNGQQEKIIRREIMDKLREMEILINE